MKLSIVTVCYNACETITDTIRSVGAQTHPNVEYIVVDGGSDDGTINILSANEDVIDKWVSEPDNGLYDAMNKGLRMASGDFVGFLNADDYFASPDALQTVAEKIKNTEADCVLADSIIVDAERTDQINRFYSARSFRPWQLRFGHMPCHPSTYVRREHLLTLGGFDTTFRICADFDLLLALYKRLQPKAVYLPKTVVVMRDGGLSSRGLDSTFRINREMYASCKKNGLWTHPVVIWSKYFFKVFQYIRRPSDFTGRPVSGAK